MNVSGNMHPRFADVLMKLTHVRQFSSENNRKRVDMYM